MDDLLARFAARLSDLGVTAEVGSALPAGLGVQMTTVRLTRGTSTRAYRLLYGPTVSLADAGLARGVEPPTLVFTSFMTPRSAEAFRRAGVQYLDMVGNAWVEFDGVLLDVRGSPRPDDLAVPAHKPAGNLFSTARAQVAFALLAWPQLWEATRRELAHAAGVSLGQAHNALALLTEAGYRRDPARPGQTELLDLWAAAFPTGLATKLTLARYRGEIGPVRGVQSDDPVFVSGESAAEDLLRPATLTLYVEELDPRLPVVNKWRSDGSANIVVRRKFWQIPHDSDGALAGVRPAPWPLVYADLVTSDDPRVRTVARQWRDRFAGSDQRS
jgi:hypothetical protein